MISQQRLTDAIKAELFHDIEDRTAEELWDYNPDMDTIYEEACKRLESEGVPEGRMQGEAFYLFFEVVFERILESRWYYSVKEDANFFAQDAKQKAERPYKYYGVTKGDFLS